jgi:hypothetical protein
MPLLHVYRADDATAQRYLPYPPPSSRPASVAPPYTTYPGFANSSQDLHPVNEHAYSSHNAQAFHQLDPSLYGYGNSIGAPRHPYRASSCDADKWSRDYSTTNATTHTYPPSRDVSMMPMPRATSVMSPPPPAQVSPNHLPEYSSLTLSNYSQLYPPAGDRPVNRPPVLVRRPRQP